MFKLTLKYQIMLILLWGLALFYQTQFAEISLVDDFGALSDILTQDHFSVKEMFFPRSIGGYYRPFIGASYWLDKTFWFLDPKNMHFESVVAHLCNSILLFFIARKAMQLYVNTKEGYLPLAVSLLFVAHPIVTESVNWISGRTDLMMSSFILVSLLSILHYRSNRSPLLLLFALVNAAASMLAKEAALGYIIAMPLLLMDNNTTAPENNICSDSVRFKPVPFFISFALMVVAAIYGGNYWLVCIVALGYFSCLIFYNYLKQNTLLNQIAVRRLLLCTPVFIISVIAFWGMRKAVFTASVGKIGQTVTLMLSDLNYTIELFTGALGFYVKKFFIPLPLNFFIHEVDPLYDLLGLLVILLIILLFTMNELPALLVLAGFFLLLPALPFSFGTIAWSSYAERYIYLSSAFWLLGLSLWVNRWSSRYQQYRRYVVLATAVICIAGGYGTFRRNEVWQTNVALMKDTLAHNPRKRILYDIYIKSLLNAGLTDEAERQYRLADQVVPAGNDDSSDLGIGALLVKQKRYMEALELYQAANLRTRFSSEKLLTASIDLLVLMHRDNNIPNYEQNRLTSLKSEYSERRLVITRNPVLFIEKGRVLLHDGDFCGANLWFSKALNYTPVKNVKMINRIQLFMHQAEEHCEE